MRQQESKKKGTDVARPSVRPCVTVHTIVPFCPVLSCTSLRPGKEKKRRQVPPAPFPLLLLCQRVAVFFFSFFPSFFHRLPEDDLVS